MEVEFFLLARKCGEFAGGMGPRENRYLKTLQGNDGLFKYSPSCSSVSKRHTKLLVNGGVHVQRWKVTTLRDNSILCVADILSVKITKIRAISPRRNDTVTTGDLFLRTVGVMKSRENVKVESRSTDSITMLPSLTLQSKVLSFENVTKFLTAAPYETFLFMIVLVFGLSGACRGDELYILPVGDIQDNGSVLAVTLNGTKANKKRVFTITSGADPIDGVKLYRRYVGLQPKNVPHQSFFVCYRNGKCTIQPVGINTFYSSSRKIAGYLK